MLSVKFIIAILIFIFTFYFIIFGKLAKSITAIVGASMMVIFRIINQEEAIEAISHNLEIIFLLMGMMMVVELMSQSGIFQWLAIKVAQLGKGNPVNILISLAIVTALCSAFLDNVTTILLMVPISILLAKKLELDPFPFVIVQIFACNIGGTATMIGDPPNLIIASAGKLSFNDFILYLSPIIIINLILLILTALIIFKKNMRVSRELRATIMDLEPNRSITDKKLMIRSIILFSIILIGFLTNMVTNIGLAIISIFGSVILLLLSGRSPEEIYKKIEWETLFFFGGLFVVIEGVNSLGIMNKIGSFIISSTNGNLVLTTVVILIMSFLLSPILGSVPYTLSMSSVVQNISNSFDSSTNINILWWALSLGACLGSNLTIVGAPANLVGISIAEKANMKVSFSKFLKYGIIVVSESMIMSLIYIYIKN